ncbi:hypothetical protein DdX_13928 [Ditylenchus destructor]|uniref:Uncharacterized protein n=1 Tax=Ditylenchus destructor TaxID=166010 RepID=A0AAD4MY14_9BILA|nr:hypothetical protein DdX_13928 [Ditylenchus destructor]
MNEFAVWSIKDLMNAGECLDKCEKRVVYSEEFILVSKLKLMYDAAKPLHDNIAETTKLKDCIEKLRSDQTILQLVQIPWNFHSSISQYDEKCRSLLENMKKTVPVMRHKCGDRGTELALKSQKESLISFSKMKGIKMLPGKCHELLRFLNAPKKTGSNLFVKSMATIADKIFG